GLPSKSCVARRSGCERRTVAPWEHLTDAFSGRRARMRRAVSSLGAVMLAALLQAGQVRAAPEEQVLITESRERACRSLWNASGTEGGGFSTATTLPPPDGSLPAPRLQPLRSTS